MSVPVAVLVAADNPERIALLATQLQLPLIDDIAALPADCVALLQYCDNTLQLLPADNRQSGPVFVDFCKGTNAHRLQGGAELIAKAVRGRSKEPLRVLDATAGLGRDSFVLAGRGFTVHMLERSPIVAALLADGLGRARQCGDTQLEEIVRRMTVTSIDAASYLSALSDTQFPDVIYLDPMFPPSDKSALVKKEMRLFQQLFHTEAEDQTGLLTLARRRARLRVVVKRPRKAEPLARQASDYALEGKSVRFDVYVAKSIAS